MSDKLYVIKMMTAKTTVIQDVATGKEFKAPTAEILATHRAIQPGDVFTVVENARTRKARIIIQNVTDAEFTEQHSSAIVAAIETDEENKNA